MSLWMDHMRRGDFPAAWAVSDRDLLARRGIPFDPRRPRHQQSIWDGRPLAGQRVLIRCYHGLGDTIQFVRYTPLVKALAVEVTLWTQPALIPLLQTARGVDRLLPLHDGMPEADFDVDVEIMELPHVFRSTLATLPATVPYLHPPSPPAPESEPPRSLAVGLVWQSGDWDPARSVPVAVLAPRLAAIPGVTLHCLQRGPAASAWRQEFGAPSGSDDALTLAGIMQTLDLVITVDSFPAHLAGALGRPTWTLLPANPDWRWLEGRGDSPWYPTMRLFRQERPGESAPVVERVAAGLAELSAGRRGCG